MSAILKTVKKVAFVLICLILAAVLVACKGKESEQQESDSDAASLIIVRDALSEYAIIRASDADSVEKNAVIELRKQLKEKCGVTLETTDYASKGDKKAIYVGPVECETVKAVTSDLGYSDYIITVSGTDVIICGRALSSYRQRRSYGRL